MKKVLIFVAVLSIMTLGFTTMTPTTAHAIPNVCAEHPEQPGCQGGGDGGEGGGDIINNGGEGGDGGTGIGIGIGGEGGQGGQGGQGGEGGDASVGDIDNSSDNSNTNEQNVTVEGDNVTYEAKRDLVGPPVIGVPNTPAFGEQATPTGNVQKVQNILVFQAEFTYAQLKALRGTDTHPVSERAKVRAKYYSTKKGADLTDDSRILVVLAAVDKDGNITRPEGAYTPAVHITVEGKSSTTTVSAFARSAIAALEGGCDMLIVTGEGAKRMMEAGGLGLMLGSSVMTLSDGAKNATGTATVGGLGYASAWASYGYCPWLQSVGAIRR